MENGENIHQVLSIGVCWKSNDANQAKGWCFVFFFFFFFFSFLMKYTHTHTYIFRIYISLNIQLFCRVLCVKVVIYRKKWWRVIAIWHEHFVSLTMGRGRVRGRVKWTAPPLHVDFMLLIFSMGNRLSRRTLPPPPLTSSLRRSLNIGPNTALQIRHGPIKIPLLFKLLLSRRRSNWTKYDRKDSIMMGYLCSWIGEVKPRNLSINWTFGRNGSDHRAARTVVQPSMVLKLTLPEG